MPLTHSKTMATVILDCYTDEPSGLGVPPYLGTYPRYLYGYLKHNEPEEEVIYLTIDDVRLLVKYGNIKPETKVSQKTDISVYNITNNSPNIRDILSNCSRMFINLGIHTPGKYLSAIPGTLHEVIKLFNKLPDQLTNYKNVNNSKNED